MQIGINLRNYFNSNFPFHKINSQNYIELHIDPRTRLISSNEKSLKQIILNYKKVVEVNLT